MVLSSTRGKSTPAGGGSEAALPLGIVAFVVVAVGGSYGATHLAAIATGEAPPPANPIDLIFGLINGEVTWSTTATIVAVALALAVLLLVVLVLRLRGNTRSGTKGQTRADPAARSMGSGRDIEELTRAHAKRKAKDLGVQSEQVGLPLARTVVGRQELYSDWESVLLDIAGPRRGKTVCMGIPNVLAAPGCVLATSNKRDLTDATRGPRAERGRVWVFDPQHVAAEEPSWWWDPLTYVTDEVKARALAEHFASNARADGASTDGFFDPAGKALLAGLLLAAAVERRPITQVYTWLTRPSDTEPAEILEREYPLTSDELRGVIHSPDRQRGGVYGTAQQMCRVLTQRELARWITPQGPGEARPHLDPAAFVRSTDALYLLSMEGPGSAGAIVTALTAAVIEAAEDYARTQRGGRLSVPMLCLLDEAANVCRWAELPNLYSHFGSRGIILRTILQSWSQGVGVWGETGMNKLWSAANIKSYCGGVDEEKFLQHVSALVGDHDREHVSISRSRGGSSVSRSMQRQRILDVSDLRALPKGRAVILGSGSKAALVRTVPWMAGPHVQAVRASIAAHDPAAEQTLDRVFTELEQVQYAEQNRAPGLGDEQGAQAL